MIRKLSFSLLISCIAASSCYAQVRNYDNVYVRPGTEIHVAGAFNNMSSSTFTLDEKAVLYVDGDLNNDGIMNIKDDASLLRGATSADGGSGVYNVTQLGGTTNGFNYWGTPVVVSGTVPGSPSYGFDPAESTQDPNDDTNPYVDPGWFSFNGNMVPGKGYAGVSAGAVTFTDNAVNNGDITPSLLIETYVTNPIPGVKRTPFNLMGNPYPSGLDLTKLVDDNLGIFGSFYFWVDDGSGGSGYNASDYAVWNRFGSVPNTGANGSPPPNGHVKTGQGFMVRNGDIGTGASQLKFRNTQRVRNIQSNAFFKVNADESKLWLSVNGNGPQFFSQILVGTTEDATTGEDPLYDAVRVSANTGASLSAVNEQREYTILVLPPPSMEEVIPLSVFIGVSGQFTFKADEMIGFQDLDVYFTDADPSGTSTLLAEGTTVTVNLAAGTYDNRFYLNFMPNLTVGIDRATENSMRAWAFSDRLTIERKGEFEGDSHLQLFDMSGKLVFDDPNQLFANNQSSVSLKGLATGIYVVKVINDKSVFSQKFIKR